MVESVTMSLAAGIIALVILTMALRRALKRRARQGRSDAIAATPEESESDRLRSRKAS